MPDKSYLAGGSCTISGLILRYVLTFCTKFKLFKLFLGTFLHNSRLGSENICLLFSVDMQETEKVALAESTGLDQKQINNWFINQRKRHWKPSEDLQFMVMDGLHPQNATIYMDGHYMGDGHYRLGP